MKIDKKRGLLLSFIILFVLISDLLLAAECMTPQQVADERTRCLFIYESNVFQKGMYPTKHWEHSCGSDVTDVMRNTHLDNPNIYLWPNLIAPLCETTTTTTSTTTTTIQTTTTSQTTTVPGSSTILTTTTTLFACTPDCSGKECGDDGCGSSCGSCGAHESCSGGICVYSECISDSDCSGDLPYCYTYENVCVKCLQSDHCDDNNVCTDDFCSLNYCVNENVANNIACSDCESDDCWCQSGNCTPIKTEEEKPPKKDEQSSQKETLPVTQTKNENTDTGKLSEKRKLVEEKIKNFITRFETGLYSIIGRITGMLAYFFLALHTLVGVYRMPLIKKLGRKLVIRSHVVLSIISLIFVIIHILSLMNDSVVWGTFLTFSKIFIPSFETSTNISISYGVFALYFIMIGIIGGILFRFISKRFGYKIWIWLHRTTYFSYIAIYFHSLNLGTDFKAYQLIFQLIFVAIVLKYFKNLIHRKKKLKEIKSIKTTRTKTFDIDAIKPLNEIIYDPTLINKKVHFRCFLQKDQRTQDIHWYTAYDNTAIVEVYLGTHLDDGYYNLKGVLYHYGEQPYVKITDVLV